MFKTLQKGFPRDKDFPERTFRLQVLQRVLNGSLYDELKHPFQKEETDAGEYIPMRERRPSVRMNLCRTVVNDSVSLLFSEGHFPTVEMADRKQKLAMSKLIKESRLNELMIDVATKGSVGSIAVLFRVLENRVFFCPLETDYLTPIWKPKAPDTLEKVREQYKVPGSALKAMNYPISADEMSTPFWFMREWDEAAEIWYQPWKVSEDAEKKAANQVYTPVVDDLRTVTHELGFVPIVWIRNLPGGDSTDGKPTFCDEAIDTQIEIDYQLSQDGRGLKYTSDPTLAITEPPGGSGGISDGDGGSEATIKGAANALMVPEGGEAKLLEINGTGSAAVLEYVKYLREIQLETLHGNRVSPEKMASAQSGRAMELMQQALVWLADRLRISYGEYGLLELLHMIAKAADKFELVFKDGEKVGTFDIKKGIALRWPKWFAPTMQDMLTRATTLKTLCDSGLLSRETAIKILAAEYDIEDPAAEKLLADADMAARNALAQVKATITE